MSALRHFSDLPAHVEEDHGDVLWHVLNAVGAKRIALTGNVLVHVDAHPDLGIPHNLDEETVRNKTRLSESVSIENWILPLSYLGIVNDIVWVRSQWSSQLRDGIHRFHIGLHRNTGYVRVSCTENYFVSEGLCCPMEELDQSREVRLLVTPLTGSLSENINEFLSLREGPDEEQGLILDICLDFFSVQNPFLDVYGKSGTYELLKDLYTYSPVDPNDKQQCCEVSAARARLLEELSGIFKHLDSGKSLDSYEGPGVHHMPKVEHLKQILESDYSREGKIDWIVVHNAGCTQDDTDLPHHITDPREREDMYRLLKMFLEKRCLLEPPKLITIARSALDEFCPQNQVEEIQIKVLEMLQCMFENIRVHMGYLDQ